jgi:hypothetical protein
MKFEIGAEAVLFPKKKYIKGSFVAVIRKPFLIYDFVPDLKFLIFEKILFSFLSVWMSVLGHGTGPRCQSSHVLHRLPLWR